MKTLERLRKNILALGPKACGAVGYKGDTALLIRNRRAYAPSKYTPLKF